MPKCKMTGCKNSTQYRNTVQVYCSMHLARVRRHGYPEPKKDAYQSLEKLPHKFVDDFILKNCQKMLDKEIVDRLQKLGYRDITSWNVRYRRRKLGVKKYLSGEIKKHKAWIRSLAINKYGDKCELCTYNLTIDVHHILPKHKGGPHEIDNLMILCPNCHALVTRDFIKLKNRKNIPKAQKEVKILLDKV